MLVGAEADAVVVAALDELLGDVEDVVLVLSPTPDSGDWACEGGVLVGLEGDAGIVPASDEPSLEEIVGGADSDTLKESSAEADRPLESCKLAMNENVPAAVGIPDRMPPAESSERPGGRSLPRTLQK